MTGKLTILARVLPDGAAIRVTGREAETLLALAEAGGEGITPLTRHRAGPAFRLAAYVFDLKHLGVPISMCRERHAGGFHARYRLAASVEILARSDGEATAWRAA